MKKLFYITILTSCSNKRIDNCKGHILDLEIKSFGNSENKIINYYKTENFLEIIDTNHLLRFEIPRRIAYFFQPSILDSTKRKYTYKVKESIIKTDEYQWDLYQFNYNMSLI